MHFQIRRAASVARHFGAAEAGQRNTMQNDPETRDANPLPGKERAMKTLLTMLTPLAAAIAVLATTAAPASAQPGDWFHNDHRTGPDYRAERQLRELRERERDLLDGRFDALEEQLEHWYEREKDLRKAQYDRHKHYLHGIERAKLTQRYHASLADLRREYRHKKERLDDREDLFEDQIKHRYDRQRDALRHQSYGRGHSSWYRGPARGLPGGIGSGHGYPGQRPGSDRDRHPGHGCRADRHSQIGLTIGLPRGGSFSIGF
jgi:hypothetical protein